MGSTSLVLELQRLAQDGSTGLSELLRRAKVVAVKLDLREARVWIEQEMNGYATRGAVPAYRFVPTELKARNPFHGWQPVVWEGANPLQEHFSLEKVAMPLSEIESVAHKDGAPHSGISQEESDLLQSLGNGQLTRLPLARFYAPASFVRILEAVRTKILDFSLELERNGVLGEGMTFNASEKRDAVGVVLNVYSAGQVAAQGANATATGNVMGQTLMPANAGDLNRALVELTQLREALSPHIRLREDAVEVGRVGQAEEAALRGDLGAVVMEVGKLNWKTWDVVGRLSLEWLKSRAPK